MTVAAAGAASGSVSGSGLLDTAEAADLLLRVDDAHVFVGKIAGSWNLKIGVCENDILKLWTAFVGSFLGLIFENHHYFRSGFEK